MFGANEAGTLFDGIIAGQLDAIIAGAIPTIITIAAILYSVIITWRFARRNIR